MNHPDYPAAAQTSYMLTWANFGYPDNMFVPYRDIHGDLGGDHELLPDFQQFHDDDRTIFSEGVESGYGDGGYSVAPHDPFMYVVSPTNGDSIISSPLELRARVVNGGDPEVTYSIDGGEEIEMELDDQYYQATWTPTAEYNESAADVTVRYYENDELVKEETHRYYIYLSDILVKEWTFENQDDIDGIQNNGTYPDDASLSLSLDDRGMLALDVEDMPTDENWQELQLELIDLDNVDIQSVNQISYDAYLPITLGEGSFTTSVQLSPDWETDYANQVELADLETETIDGEEYYVLNESISFPILAETDGYGLSLIGDQLDMSDTIYIDNICLENSYVPAPDDPFLVDNFEGYMGDDALLDRAYGSNGDRIELSLTEERKFDGEYGLQYDYTLGSQGYAGREISLNSLDWTGKNGVSFWMENQGHEDHHLTLQINIGGIGFEAEIELEEPHEGIIEIPFAEFAPADWEGNQDAIIDTSRIQSVTSFALYMGGDPLGEGTLYFDEIRTVEIEDAPDVPEPEESEPADPIVYDFEEDLAGWEGPEAMIEDGNLKAVVALDDSTEVNKISSYNLSGYNYVVASIKTEELAELNEHPLNAEIFAKTGSEWDWHASDAVELSSDEYTDIIFDISDLEEKDNVPEIGIQFVPSGEEQEGTTEIFVDMVQIVNDLDELIDGGDPEEPEDPVEDVISDLEAEIEDLTNRLEELEAMGENVAELERLLAELRGDVEVIQVDAENFEVVVSDLLTRIEALEMQIAEREEEVKESLAEEDPSKTDETSDEELDDEDTALPSTATPLFNYLLIGALILIVGAGLAFYSYKRKRA